MAKKTKTKATSVGAEKLYLSKAEKFLTGAKLLIESKNWEGAATLGIHAIISSCDALTAKFLRLRHAGSKHLDVLDLLSELPIADKKELKGMKKRISSVLTSKTNIEYDEKPIKRKQAEDVVRDAEKVFAWAQKHIK